MAQNCQLWTSLITQRMAEKIWMHIKNALQNLVNIKIGIFFLPKSWPCSYKLCTYTITDRDTSISISFILFFFKLKDLVKFIAIALSVVLGVGIYYHANLWPDHQTMWSGGLTRWRIWTIIFYPYWQIYGEANLETLTGTDFFLIFFFSRVHTMIYSRALVKDM